MKYLVFEWIHGSGKSFIPEKLEEKRLSVWKKVKYFHFPNEDEPLGKIIRSVVANKKIYDKREATGLLYAAHANIFHYEHDDDDITYLLSRHSVSTGLIFQKDIDLETRKKIYWPGVKALQEKGIVFYLKINPQLAAERKEERNIKLLNNNSEQVRKDKANDQFIAQKYEQLALEYEYDMIPKLQELWIRTAIIDNNGTREETIRQVENIVKNK
jgi:thymidylate kinase